MRKQTIFSQAQQRKEVFIKKTRKKTTHKEARKHLKELKLAVTLSKVINHFFPELLPALARVNDPKNASYITYSGKVILMTRILSSVFYISSMRKSSEEFNSDKVIQNIGYLCDEELEELPYWKTINNYLKRLEADELQKVIIELVKKLIRSRAFEEGRIWKKYWQIVLDGTGLCSSRKKLDGKSLYKVYNRGYFINFVEYREEEDAPEKKKRKATEKKFYFITDLSITKGQAVEVAEYGRRRWKIENEGFNTQKRQGYNLEHRYSHNYQATKNHYYLIQIGHMIAQIIEAWETIWKGIQQSREQKHRRMFVFCQ